MIGEHFFGHGGCNVGSNVALLLLYRSLATLYTRAWIYEVLVGCAQAPADVACDFTVRRTTTVGTGGSAVTPNNLDPNGPASQSTFISGTFTGEPTKTADKQLLRLPPNQRGALKWTARYGAELILPCTQNAGACVNSESTTGGSVAWIATMYYAE